jgi:hypothetical protein
VTSPPGCSPFGWVRSRGYLLKEATVDEVLSALRAVSTGQVIFGGSVARQVLVAGSHRALIQPAFVRRDLDLPQLDLPTETGDVTVHCSCTLHMSEPPVERGRRVLYTDFSLPTDEGARSPNEDVLRRVRERAPTTVSQPPGHVPAG